MSLTRRIALAAAVLLLGVTPFRADRQTRWAQFRLGGGLNVVVANPALPVEPAWRFPGGRKGTSASPSVFGTTVLIASNDRHLYALDAATGRPRWRYAGDDELMSQPVFADGIVYVGSGDSDAAIWAPPFYKLVGAGKNVIAALDLNTGKVVWRLNVPGAAMVTPALVGRLLVQSDGAGMVYALDARTGAYAWRTYIASDADMSQTLDGGDGRIYVIGDWPNAAYALDARTGAILWRHWFPTYDGAFSDCPFASDPRTLYAMYVRQTPPMRQPYVPFGRPAQQYVYALEKQSGRTLWDRPLPHVTGVIPTNNESAIPLLDGGLLYDGSGIAPIVSALDPRTGTTRWQVSVDGPVKGGIVALDGVLYFGDLKGSLWAVDAHTGLKIGSIKTDLSFNVGSPIVVNGSLVIGSQEGPMIAVPLAAIRSSHAIAGVTTAFHDSPAAVAAAILGLIVLAAIGFALSPRRRRGVLR